MKAGSVSIGCQISNKPAVTVAVDGKIVAEIEPQKFLDSTGLGHFFFQLKPSFVSFMRKEERAKPVRRRKSVIEMSIGVCGVGVLDHPDSDMTPAELRAIAEVFMTAATYREQGAYGEIRCRDGKEILAHIGLDHKDKELPESGLPILKEIKVNA